MKENLSIDIPAISAAAIAGAISVSMGSGPYTWMSAIIGICLILFLYAYAWGIKKEKFHQIAFVSIFSFLWLLPIAPILEFYYRGNIPNNCLDYYEFSMDIMIIKTNNNLDINCIEFSGYNSLVSDIKLLLIWFVICIITWIMQSYSHRVKESIKKLNRNI